MKFKKIALALGVASALLLSACSEEEKSGFVVAATPVPHAEILEVVKPILEKEGVELKIKEFSDYVQPNLLTEEKEVDANFFQHQPYLDSFNQDHDTHLVSVGAVHVEPFGLYSNRIKDLSQLSQGAVVALPNDPSNAARALLLLQSAGLIELKDPKNLSATARDVVKNPKALVFKEVEAAMLPRILDEVDLALINTNYALQASLNPLKDALLLEGEDSPYANIFSVLEENKDDETVQKVFKALRSPEVKQFILEKYKGAVVPAFE